MKIFGIEFGKDAKPEEIEEELKKAGIKKQEENSLNEEKLKEMINNTVSDMLKGFKPQEETKKVDTGNDVLNALIENQKALQASIQQIAEMNTKNNEQFKKEFLLEQQYSSVLSEIPDSNKSFIESLEKNGVGKDKILEIIKQNNLTSPMNTDYKHIPPVDLAKTEAEEISNTDIAKANGVTKEMLLDSDIKNPSSLSNLLQNHLGNGDLVSPATSLNNFLNELNRSNNG